MQLTVHQYFVEDADDDIEPLKVRVTNLAVDEQDKSDFVLFINKEKILEWKTEDFSKGEDDLLEFLGLK